jgi:hypothetical protein
VSDTEKAKDKEKKRWHSHLPAILTTLIAVAGTVTTIYVNLRNDRRAEDRASLLLQAQQLANQEKLEAREDRAAASSHQQLYLSLDRIVVENDGAAGTANWRFAVEAGGYPLFVFAREKMTDREGRNVAIPEQPMGAVLNLDRGESVAITIRGWREGWFRRGDEPLVSGQARLTFGGTLEPIRVGSENPKDGRFLFLLSVAPVRK